MTLCKRIGCNRKATHRAIMHGCETYGPPRKVAARYCHDHAKSQAQAWIEANGRKAEVEPLEG